MPNACIGVDVIVGFPGETEADFNDTYVFLRDLDISYLHVFTYSERPNTTALRIDAVVPMETRHQRNKMLRILSDKKQHAFYQSQLESTSEVLFESEEDGGQMYGFTKNYLKVKTPFDESLINKIKTVKIESIDRDGVAKVQLLNEPLYV